MTASLVDHDPHDLNARILIGSDGCTVTALGDVDAVTVPHLSERLLGLFDRPGVTDVELDLTGVTSWALPGSGPWSSRARGPNVRARCSRSVAARVELSSGHS